MFLQRFRLQCGSNTPHFWQIKNFLEQSALSHRIKVFAEVASHMKTLARTKILSKFNFVNMRNPAKFIRKGKPSNFIVEPIPEWCMPVQAYVLDMGVVKLNECQKYCFEFVFHGLGVFNASVRADVAIPGLAIKVSMRLLILFMVKNFFKIGTYF